MSRSLRWCAVLLSTLLTLTAVAGCGESTDRTRVETTKKAETVSTIDITFQGDTVEPQGSSVKVKAGKPLTLHITADKPGEIHVHSSPEQAIEYDAGTTDKTLTLDQPGVVDVESHTLDKLIVQLEVR